MITHFICKPVLFSISLFSSDCMKSCWISSRAARARNGFLEPWVLRDGRTERLCSATAELKLNTNRALTCILSHTDKYPTDKHVQMLALHRCVVLTESAQVRLCVSSSGWTRCQRRGFRGHLSTKHLTLLDFTGANGLCFCKDVFGRVFLLTACLK